MTPPRASKASKSDIRPTGDWGPSAEESGDLIVFPEMSQMKPGIL